MQKLRFKYKLSRGSKIYRCGPQNHGKLRNIISDYRYQTITSRIISFFILLCVWAGIILSMVFLYLALTLPNIDNITNATRPASITILDNKGNTITTINDTYGKTVEVDTLPPHVWQAVIAVEDKRFFDHFGVDLRGLARAIYNNIKQNKTAQGGSTITQQLAKNVFLSNERSLSRKIQEVMITLWLEHKFTKKQILSLYLNRVSLVGGKYGISIAANTLFGKEIEDINIAESAILAGMLKAPSRLNPQNNKESSLARAKTVLTLMRDQDFITSEEYATAINYEYISAQNNFNQVRYFIDYTMAEFNSLTQLGSNDIIITTTLDLPLQKTVENITKSYTTKDGIKYNFSQIGMIILDTNGKILSLIGGVDYNKSQFNRATQSKRQPGSIFKPFVYLSAVENGLKPNDMFEDKITAIGDWAPKNHDEKYVGLISMRDALEKSVNTVPVQISKKIGLSKIINVARKLGLVDNINNDSSIILGTSETTLLDLTSAYAVFANKGNSVIPHSISKIEETSPSQTTTVYERKLSGVGRLISESNTKTMNDMLKNVVDGGTGANAGIHGKTLHGKTGTSQNNRDAWFIGYDDKTIIGIWIGNDDNTPMSKSSYGGTIPAKIFRAVMTYILTI